MKLSAVFLCVLVSAATCQFADEGSSNAVFSGKERPQNFGIIQNLIEDFLDSIAGQKEHRIPKINIDGSSRYYLNAVDLTSQTSPRIFTLAYPILT